MVLLLVGICIGVFTYYLLTDNTNKDLTNEFVNGSYIKSDAIHKVFNTRYPNLEVKKVKSKRLTVL